MDSAFPHVLVVDDDESFHEFWLHELTERYSKLAEFRLVSSLDAAFRELCRREDYYDVVLLDLGLPPFWGIDTYRRFVEKGGSIPVIVITGDDDPRLDAQLKEEGAERVIWKSSVNDSSGQSRGETIVKAVVDVFMEQTHSSHVEHEFHRITRELNSANSGLMEAVRSSVRPPSDLEVQSGKARAAESELVAMLAAETFKIAKSTAKGRAEVKALRALINNLVRKIEQSDTLARGAHESIADFQKDQEFETAVTAAAEKRNTAIATIRARAWKRRKEIVGLVLGTVATVASGYFSYLAGTSGQQPAPQPKPQQPSASPDGGSAPK